ncbi:hypothetical protein D3C78_461950 [compost metagenome]
MPVRRVDLQITDVLACRHQGIDDLARAGRRETPVGGERHDAVVGCDVGQGRGQVAAIGRRRVEVIQRLGHQQVGVGVEAARELFALIAQVALDLEFDAVEVVIELVALELPAKLFPHRVVGQVGDMPDHTRQHQATLGDHALVLERAAVEFGVGEDGLARHFVEGNVLGRQLWCRGDIDAVAHAVGVGHGPLQGLHAAEAAADNGRPLPDAQAIGKACLAVYPVFNGQYREIGAIRLAGGGVDAAGAGAAVAATEVVQADHEETVGVDRLARADAAVPPAGLAVGGGVVAGRVVMARQGMADQHSIACAGIQAAICLVDQLVAGQRTATGQGQRFIEPGCLRCNQTDGIFGKDSGHRPCSRLTEA